MHDLHYGASPLITRATLTEAMAQAMRLAATRLPPDIETALRQAKNDESEPIAVEQLRVSLENARLAQAEGGLVCGDTGFPLFFVTAGSQTTIEGGFETLWKAARAATKTVTDECYLRPTMVDPLSRDNPGDNCGPGMPKLELRFEGEGASLEIVAAPKGGGSEIFGTFYRMLFPSDGEAGIMKFVLDSVRDGCFAGKICPPAIIGVGIGGTADLCVKMAKEAAVLRHVGEPHPDSKIDAMERRLVAAIHDLGIGPMGSKGKNAVMAVHIETALTHTAALPVAVNAQCLVGRRWTAKVSADNLVEYAG